MSNTTTRTWFSFAEANRRLGTSMVGVIADGVSLQYYSPNTRVVVLDQQLAIVYILANGTFQLYHGSERSERIRQAIMQYSPAKISAPHSDRWQLPGLLEYIGDYWTNRPFVGGMIVDKFGWEICKRHNPLTPANAAL